MAADLTIRMTTDNEWLIQTKDIEGIPIAYDDADVLTAFVWVGSDQAVLFNPTTEWVDSVTGQFRLNISASQVTPTTDTDIASTVEPGTYQVLVTVQRITANVTQQAWSGTLEILPAPGIETPLRAYARYRDILAVSQGITDALALSDETGFAYQLHLATEWLDGIILSRAASMPQNFAGYGYNDQSFGFYSQQPGATNAVLKGYLEAGKLMVTPLVREIVSRRAVGMILGSVGSQTKQNTQSGRQYAAADALISTYVAEIDTNDDGIADIVIPCNYFNSRTPTPATSRRWS